MPNDITVLEEIEEQDLVQVMVVQLLWFLQGLHQLDTNL